MEFEHDPAKSELNGAKHGLDFEAAQSLWNDQIVLALQQSERKSLRPARDVEREALGRVLYSQRKQDTDHLSEKSSSQRKETI